MINELFKNAIRKMIELDEFEKIIKNTSGDERNKAEVDNEFLKNITYYKNNQISFIQLLHEIQSVEVLKDIISFMVTLEGDKK